VQTPAVLAGSLAGERERGVLQLLLTTAVTPREIVMGRLLGKLSQVAMIVLAGLPIVAVLFALTGLSPAQLATFFLLLASVGLGAGGLAVGASVVSRRGRDALLSVYILMVMLLISPLLSWVGLPRTIVVWLEWLNPFASMARLVDGDRELAPALATSGIWLAQGALGTAIAAWRLRPSCLAAGEVVKKSRRRLFVPAVGERPMLWKELYIERVGTLGRFGRWMGALVTLAIGGGSLALAGFIVVDLVRQQDTELSRWAREFLVAMLSSGASAGFMACLLQWAIGLRAAVAIASERERATWDAILLTQLEPGEIVRAKVIGSMHALRWMVGAMVLAWTVGVIFGAVSVGQYATWLVTNALMGALMAAIGVRLSLSLSTATRAMTWTIGSWVAGWATIAALAGCIIALWWMGVMAVWTIAIQYGFASPTIMPSSPISLELGWVLSNNLVILLLGVLIVLDTSLRFDRITGRMAGGAVATTIDEFLYGRTIRPVFMPAKKQRAAKSEELVDDDLGVALPPIDMVTAE
jgi:ABC-type Na+ efflux pump permease subunit